MDKRVILLALFVFSSVYSTVLAQDPAGSFLDAKAGFDTIQEPFSEFLDKSTKVDVGQGSGTGSSSIPLPSPVEIKDSWDKANDWVKERTGLDILSILKVIGNILVFVMNLVINTLSFLVGAIQWLLSLIPNPVG